MTERSIELHQLPADPETALPSPENLVALHQAANLLGTSSAAEVEHVREAGETRGAVRLSIDPGNGDTLIEITDEAAPLELQFDENATRMPRVVGGGIRLRLSRPDTPEIGSPLYRTYAAPDAEQSLALARYLERIRTSAEYRFVRHTASRPGRSD